MKSSSPGLLKNGQKFFCMYSGTQENNKIEVQTVLLDTLYSTVQYSTVPGQARVHVGVEEDALPDGGGELQQPVVAAIGTG